jgi:hypothetical protein
MHLHVTSILLLLQTTTTLTLACLRPTSNTSPAPVDVKVPTPTLLATQSPTVTAAGFAQSFASTALGGWNLGSTPRVGKVGLGGGVKGGVKMERGEDEKKDGEGEGGKAKRQGRYGPYPKGYPPHRDPNVIASLEENHKKTAAKNGKRDTPGCPYWCPKGPRHGKRKGGDEDGGVKEKRDTLDADNSLVIPSRTKWPGSGSVGGWKRIE